ncbi:S8 family serine peptidase, partial [Kamptonema sp. UHCC 0994]|uniref:S8 family serine peptidase n=1 Tax=Kamptonema sp. UHCC 0994 TaxID=3031329 RepID=UPI0023B8E64E
MPANDLSLVSGSQIHTGQVGTTYPDTLYNLTGNADLLLKTSSGTILDISTTIGTIPDEINVKELAAEDNSLLVPSKGGDTDYNPSQKLGEVANSEKLVVDPLTGSNSEPPATTIVSNNPSEKSTDSTDLITGDPVENQDATAPSNTLTGTTYDTDSTDKITETGSEVGITSATEKSLEETVASPDKSSNEITNLETKTSPEKPITSDSETTDSLTRVSTTESPDKSTDSAASEIISETTKSPDTTISNSVESAAASNTENAALSNGETNNEPTIAPLTQIATISETGAEFKEIVTSPSQLTNSVESTAIPDLVTGEFVENPTEKSPSNSQITTLSNAEDSQEESLTLSSDKTTILPEVKPLPTSEDKPDIQLEITQETVASNGTNSNDLTGSFTDKKTEESSSDSANNNPTVTTNSPDDHQSGLAEEETKIENHVIENSITNEPKETVAGDKLTTEKPVDTSSETTNTTNTEKNPAVNGGEEEKKAEDEAEVSSDETQKELNPTASQPELTASPDPFTSGKFKVDTTGKVGIDFLFDGGLYQGQLAIFSLKGMAIFIPGSEAFIKEATARALSKSVQGNVVISDLSEGARFSGKLGEENFNSGEYLGVKTFDMTPGDEFGVMIVPNGTVQEVFDNPGIGGNKRPLFSMATANPENGMQIGQIADVTGEGNTFSMEDLRVDGWTDKDYNDFVFQVRGAVGKAVLMDDVVAAGKDWRTSDLGKALVDYAKPYINPEPAEDLETSLSGLLDDLENATSQQNSLENGIPTGEKDSPTTGELIEKGSVNSDDNSSSSLPSEQLDSNPDSQALAGDKEDNSTEIAATDVPLKDNSETELTSGKTEEISSNLAVLPQADQTADNLPQTAAVEVEKIDNSGVDSPEYLIVPATESLSNPAITADSKETAVIPASVVNGSVSSVSQNTEVAVTSTGASPQVKETITNNYNSTPVTPSKLAEVSGSTATTTTELTTNTSTPTIATSPTKETVTNNGQSALVTNSPAAEVVTALIKETVSATSENTTTSPVVNTSEVKAGSNQPSEIVDTNVDKIPDTSAEILTNSTTSLTPAAETIESFNAEVGTETQGSVSEWLSPSFGYEETELSSFNPVNAELIYRVETLAEILRYQQDTGINVGGNSINPALLERLDNIAANLRNKDQSIVNTATDNATANLISRLEDMVARVAPVPIEYVEPVEFAFPLTSQPLVGVIDTGFSGNNPDLDYSRIILGSDRVANDENPLLATGEGSEHGTHILGIIAATQNNGIGIDGVNDKAPLWVGRAIGSGKWAESLVEFVDKLQESGQPNGVVNLSLDLTQINPDGSVTTRYEFTPEERSAIEYARQNHVLLVVSSGNDGSVMSALGQGSQEFDNIITVGAAKRVNDEIALSKAYDRADYSSYGRGLDIMADGGTVENPVFSTTGDGVGAMVGTSVATAKVTGAVSQMWAANPQLSYRQVIDILKSTATDLKEPNWDEETGAGLLNMAAAVGLAGVTTGEVYQPNTLFTPDTWSGQGLVIAAERATATEFMGKYYEWDSYTIKPGDTLSAIAFSTMGNSSAPYYNFIAEKNGITNPNLIYVGQNILIPRQVSVPTPQPQPQPQPQPIAPLPGQGKVPVNAGQFINTILSNSVTIHYYTNGHLMVQPNGVESWYSNGTGLPIPNVKVTTTPIPISIANQATAAEKGNVVAIPDANGKLLVFAIGADNNVWQWRESDNNMTWWHKMGLLAKEISVIRDKNGQLRVFGIGTDDNVWQWRESDNNMTWWHKMGLLGKEIEVIQASDGSLRVFGIGTDDNVWQWRESDNNMTWWHKMGLLGKEIEVIQASDGSLRVFGIGTDDNVWQWRESDNNMTWW